jgi:hypothetical protein
MCDDCHLTALAAFAVKHKLAGEHCVDQVRVLLGDANVASLRARYGKRDDYEGASCPHAAGNTFAPAAIVKACDCYSYQACEYRGWQMSGARLLVQKIRLAALSLAGWDGRDPAELDIGSKAMPGYNEAAWGLDCSHDITPIVEDRDDYHARWLEECRAHGECRRQLDEALDLLKRAGAVGLECRAFTRKAR